MVSKIDDLYALATQKSQPKRLILANANDRHALEAAHTAWSQKVIELILTGDKSQIQQTADAANIDISKIEIIQESQADKAVEAAVKRVRDGGADILMKGNVQTAQLLRGVLNKEWGLRKGSLLSHFSIFEMPAYHKLLGLTDVAMNIAPDLAAKVAILNNAVDFMNAIGITRPKVAPIAAVEVVNADMPATLDAALLSKMAQRGQIKNCIIDGPLAFDNAISREAAEHKGIHSEVAGDADLILFPNIEAGNAIYKALAYLANARLAAVILGAMAPIVLTSRSDSEDAKFNSILLAAAAN